MTAPLDRRRFRQGSGATARAGGLEGAADTLCDTQAKEFGKQQGAWCVMKYSKDQKLAKDFIRYSTDRPQYDRYFEVMDTFGIPGTKVYRDNPLGSKDLNTAVFPEALPYARQVAFAGLPGARPPRRSASSSWSTCSPRASRACLPTMP